jgi:predicted nucleic acid-binding protein
VRAAIVDTGPLVAFLDRAEQHHRWVAERVEELNTPLLVCEPVLAESIHLLARFARAQKALFRLLDNGALKIAFHIEEHVPALCKLHHPARAHSPSAELGSPVMSCRRHIARSLANPLKVGLPG